jgi:hypothetical protein
MWNSTNSIIKFFDLGNTVLSEGLFFDGNLAIAPAQIHREGFSEFDDKFTVPFLYNKIRQDLPTQVEKSMSRNNPFVTVSLKELVSGFLERSRASAAECFLKPMEKANVCIRNLKNTAVVPVFIAIPRLVLQFTGMKAPLTIDNTSKIGQLKWIVNLRNVQISMFKIFVDKLCHITSMVNKFINQYTHGMCLSPG